MPVDYGQWLHHEFLPGLYSLYAEPVRLACLMSATQFADLQRDPVSLANAQMLTDPDLPFQLALFTDQTEAIEWLAKETI
ncbi:hypothetical protein [Hymenobacter koreensis]|uniref:hypothetical protein n=1 Tax=Hymenobacter koreensis TaxID=1084523 RepID=UPI0031ED353D